MIGNQIEIYKSPETNSKLHFVGKLTRKTTSIRPINSNDLGRHSLLFEGVEVSIDKEDDNEKNDMEYNKNAKTVTMEIGFENSNDMNKWLDIMLDLIN